MGTFMTLPDGNNDHMLLSCVHKVQLMFQCNFEEFVFAIKKMDLTNSTKTVVCFYVFFSVLCRIWA